MLNQIRFLIAALALISTMGCSLANLVGNTPTPTSTTPAPTSTMTATSLPPTATATSTLEPTELSTPTGEISATEPASTAPPGSAVSLPVTFNITLTAPATQCGDALVAEFKVTLTETTITMVQIEFNLTSTGPYNPATGAFTSTVSGLPGTETFRGTVSFTPGASGTVVQMNGEFTYTGDPEWTCTTPDIFTGQATINP